MRCSKFILASSLAILLGSLSHPALSGTATSNVTVSKASALRVVVTGITLDCTWPPGTVIVELGVIGGNGNAVTYTLGGTPSGDLAVNGSNIVIGPNGVAPGNCLKTEPLTINATQQ